MPRYLVIATRTDTHRLDASDSGIAIAVCTTGDEDTIEAHPLCPDCENPLTRRTERLIDKGGYTLSEPSYCDVCDREVPDQEAARVSP
jgi:hypothetical protein